ncbi:sushi, von Willebrand factor type A, EGF and pentraxin domain-containing protein 1-like isoform X3 [Engraulis encrasicolus]|uniref:sushi, von Willebrand factor type A, EGF and pentraxin domain-containing protein 1-like isoform X3 n=1 Tax=Engraulis encrasicolus TaxID=184585 RepID=UPI002FD5AFC0
MSDSRSWILQLLVTIASFFIRSEAECIAPKELGNSVILSNEHVLQNDFPDGSEAKLDCDNGFRPLNGSDTITCQNGIWSTVELTCTRKDCGPPKASPHVRFLYPKGENATLFTDRITAVCETGFRLVGSSTWQCLNYGWKGRSSCYVIECGETRNETLPVLENGETINAPHDKQRVEFGDVIQYRCHHGYHLIGNDTIKCTENGYTALPRCKKLDFYIHPSQTPKVDQRKSSGSAGDTATQGGVPGTASTAAAGTAVAGAGTGSVGSGTSAAGAGAADVTLHSTVVIAVVLTGTFIALIGISVYIWHEKNKGSYRTQESKDQQMQNPTYV